MVAKLLKFPFKLLQYAFHQGSIKVILSCTILGDKMELALATLLRHLLADEDLGTVFADPSKFLFPKSCHKYG